MLSDPKRSLTHRLEVRQRTVWSEFRVYGSGFRAGFVVNRPASVCTIRAKRVSGHGLRFRIGIRTFVGLCTVLCCFGPLKT